MATPLLPADSHTARRLEHSTHAHLHQTSLRTFIGPIPDGWLKSHRKSWYKRYVRTDGRAPTWTAAEVSTPMPGADGPVRSDSAAATSTEQTPRPSSQSADIGVGATASSTTSLLRGSRTQTQYEDARSSQTDGAPQGSLPRVPRIPNAKAMKVRFTDTTTQQLRQRARRLASQSRGALTWSKVKDGEVLKMDRMLVRMDITRQSLGVEFDEKVSAGVVTRRLDKWREFMVVCRRHSDDDAESVLQFYETRVIAANAAEMSKSNRKPKHEIPLSQRRAHVNLFSSLDKTLCIWTSDGAQTTIYYLRPQSGAAAVDWYTFLRSVLGFKRAKTLQINVPDLSVSLRLDDPFNVTNSSQILSAAADGNEDAMAAAMDAEKGAAGAIVARCLGMLEQSPNFKEVLHHWNSSEHDRVGLAWKRYDRLEWVYGAVEQRMYGTIAMAKTHELELRPKEHYPHTARGVGKGVDGGAAAAEILEEPPPVEGFLIRLTSQQGRVRRMGKMLYKRLYFASYDQYLFFTRPAHATPPPPPKMRVRQQENGNGHVGVPSSRELADALPLTYDVDPYPLSSDGKRVSWLDDAGEQRAHDEEAEKEAERNVQMLMNCDGFINLTDVRQVRRMTRGAVPADGQLEEGRDVEFNTSDADEVGRNTSRTEDGSTGEVDDTRTFELVMSNGLVVRLQAYDEQAAKAWRKRLRELVRYWKARTKADMDLFKSVRQQNLAALGGLDERAEAHIGSFATKWEVSHSLASSTLYNLCGIAQCRTIHLSGLLFRKPRRHTTFTRCYVVLSHGHLLVFRDTLRKGSGAKVEQVHHERVGSVDLRGCYLYSGLLTEEELMSRNRTFDSNEPGSHALPRMYLEDGWTSTDEDAMTTFVIWHAKSKSWFKSSQTVDDVRSSERSEERAEAAEGGGMRAKAGGKAKTKLTRVSQLGTTGRSVVFKARSRAERDHWVMGLQVEIERLAAEEVEERGEEVRLVGEGGTGS